MNIKLKKEHEHDYLIKDNEEENGINMKTSTHFI